MVKQTGFPESWDTLVKGLSLIYTKLKDQLVKPVHPRGPIHFSVVLPFYVSWPIYASVLCICASGKTLHSSFNLLIDGYKSCHLHVCSS